MRIQALLLDLDDTLLDERPGREAGRVVLVAALREARPDLGEEALREVLDRQQRWYWSDPDRHAAGRLDLLAARITIVRRALEELGVSDERRAQEAARRYEAVRDAQLAWMPGAREALAALRAAVPRLGLLTNGAAAAQRAKLVRFGLEPCFDHVQIEGDFGEGKPARRAFRHAASALGAPPEQTAMVGNDFHFDVLGALRAGLHAVWVDLEGTGGPPQAAPRSFTAVRGVHEVPALLGVPG